MTKFKNLGHKCSQMGFSDLQSFKNLTNSVYDKMMTESTNNDDRQGFEDEIGKINLVLDEVISKKIFDVILD